jgi:hypothetical protein
MSDYYTYGQRNIASTQAEKVARASETAQSIENARALYYRPKLIHSGPFVHFTPQQPEPNAWPWIRLDTDLEKNTLLDQCTFFPQHERGSLDLSLRLIGATAARPNANVDPLEVKSEADILFEVRLKQFVDNSVTPATIEFITHSQTITFHSATQYPERPVLSLISLGWTYFDSVVYDPDIQMWGDPFTNPTARPPQLYEKDMPLLQRVTMSIDFDAADFNARFPLICEVRANLGAGGISFDPQIPTTSVYRTAEYMRLFNAASTIRERGR